MATIVREVLTQSGLGFSFLVQGNSRFGISITGTWVGTIAFSASYDGVNYVPIYVSPFPPQSGGPTQNSTTVNGNFEGSVKNDMTVKVTFTQTSGSPIVVMGVSADSSYQDAFLSPTSKYVNQSVSGGAQNQVVQAAQPNRAWRLRSLSIGFSVAAGAAVLVQVTDGASSVLWSGYVSPSPDAVSGGGTFLCPLPPPTYQPGILDGGVVGTPGNSMTVTLAAPGGSVVSTVNAEFCAA